MREGFEVYVAVCQHADMAAAIAELPDGELRNLIGHVGGFANDNNVAGEVLGHALVDAAGRWINQGGTKA